MCDYGIYRCGDGGGVPHVGGLDIDDELNKTAMQVGPFVLHLSETMIRWMIFWYTQSDGLPDFDSGEGGFHF